MKQQDSFYAEKKKGLVLFCYFFFPAGPSSSILHLAWAGQRGVERPGQRAARRHQCVKSSSYSGQGSDRSSNHSQQQLNSPLKHKNPFSPLFSTVLLSAPSLHSFLQLQKGGKKNQSGGFSWIKCAKSRAVTAGVVFPNYHERLDHTRHFQRGMGRAHIPANDGNRRGVPGTASLLPPRRTDFSTSRQECQKHEGRRLEGRRDGF